MTQKKPLEQQQPSEDFQQAPHRGQHTIPTAPLPDPIAKNIEVITKLYTREEKYVPRHQQVLEAIAAFFGHPSFLYSILAFLVLWILLNVLPLRFEIFKFDPPPFAWLGLLVDVGSLLITTGVLIRQTRQERLAEQRAQLSLQLNLLSEQKIAKLITLLEELRNDLPNVNNRQDPEAKVMQQAADPRVVLDTLEENLQKELEQMRSESPANE